MSELQIRCNHRVNTTDVMYFKNCNFMPVFVVTLCLKNNCSLEVIVFHAGLLLYHL